MEHLTKKKSTLKRCFKHQNVVMNNSKRWENPPSVMGGNFTS